MISTPGGTGDHELNVSQALRESQVRAIVGENMIPTTLDVE
jgi:hypothetical protein